MNSVTDGPNRTSLQMPVSGGVAQLAQQPTSQPGGGATNAGPRGSYGASSSGGSQRPEGSSSIRTRTGASLADAVTAEQAVTVLRLAQGKPDIERSPTPAAVTQLVASGFVEHMTPEAYEAAQRAKQQIPDLEAARVELGKLQRALLNPWLYLKVLSSARADAYAARAQQRERVAELEKAVGPDPDRRLGQLKLLTRYYTKTELGMLRPTPEGNTAVFAIAGLEAQVDSFNGFAAAVRKSVADASMVAVSADAIYKRDRDPGRATAICYAIAASASDAGKVSANGIKVYQREARKMSSSEVAATLLGFSRISGGVKAEQLENVLPVFAKAEIDTRAAALLAPFVLEHGMDPNAVAASFTRASEANAPCNAVTAALLTMTELSHRVDGAEVKRRFMEVARASDRCRGLAAALLVDASFAKEASLATVLEEFRAVENKTGHDVAAAILVRVARRVGRTAYEVAGAHAVLHNGEAHRSPVLPSMLLAAQSPRGAAPELAAALLVAYAKTGYERLERGVQCTIVADSSCVLADLAVNPANASCVSVFGAECVAKGDGFDGAGGDAGGDGGGGDGDGGGGDGGSCGGCGS